MFGKRFVYALIGVILGNLFEALHDGCICETGLFDCLLRIGELFAWESGQQSKCLHCILWSSAEKYAFVNNCS